MRNFNAIIEVKNTRFWKHPPMRVSVQATSFPVAIAKAGKEARKLIRKRERITEIRVHVIASKVPVQPKTEKANGNSVA